MQVERPAAHHDALAHLSEPLLVPLSSRRYNRQFATLYDYRLRRLKHPKGRLVRMATQQWTEGKGTTSHMLLGSTDDKQRMKANYVKRILDVKQGQICFVIGTIYCSMHLKPDVLEELTREQYLPPQPPSEKYTDPEKDEYFIEDESGRVRLVGDAVAPDGHLRNSLVTGIVVAVLGTETRAGDFEVADALFAGVPEKTPISKEEVKKEEDAMEVDGPSEEGWVALVSGLEIEASSASVIVGKAPEAKQNGTADHGMMGYSEKEMKMMLLTDWILGHVGSDEERNEVSQVTSLIIAGNSLHNPARTEEDKSFRSSTTTTSSIPAPSNSYPTSNLDDFLVDIASSMHIHLLPGEKDPTSLALPQQPMHPSLFPKSSRFKSLHFQTNPSWFAVQNKKFLGSSGQNINDIFRYMIETDGQIRLDTACRTLDWGHIAPTAPDTLSCYPLSDRDPFLIEEAPDIYFVGNQPLFASRLYYGPDGHRILVVLVPDFASTGEIVLVQPSTLSVKVIQVNAVM